MKILACVLGMLSLIVGLPGRVGCAPSVWGLGAMEKVRPQTPLGKGSIVRLFAARNETVSFQVGLHGGDAGWNGVSARLLALNGPVSIQGADILLYREELLSITKPTLPYSEPGQWPDGLVPDVDETFGEKRRAFPFNIPAGESRAVWVDVHVPMDAPPGEYRGAVEVEGEGVRSTVFVSLTVVDWVMPSTPSLRTSFLLWAPSVCQAFTGERDCPPEVQFRLLSSFQKMGLEHRVTLTSRFDPEDVPEPATFDTWWSPFLSGTTPLRLPGARMTSVEYAGPSTPEHLMDFSARASASGWAPLTFYTVGDEPPIFISFDEARARSSLLRQRAPSLHTLLTISSLHALEVERLNDLIDIAVVMVNRLEPSQTAAESGPSSRSEAFLRLPGRELWLYQCCMSHGCGSGAPENLPGQGWPSYMVDVPATKARALEWVSFQRGATGEHYYQVAQMLSTAWTDQYIFSGNGDGTLFYPGKAASIGGTQDVPLPSMRLKLIRMGIQDYEWLKRVSDLGDSAFAQEVARELIPEPWLVPDEGEAFELARVRLIQRALMLSGARVPDSVNAYLREHSGPVALHDLSPVGLGPEP
ncbi:DUF4091 domain-containing protein [Melittangium boletus]|uniref:Glycoside hydrolase 123 N-terminal domain-containing protein n=1 Tax=Melittangium boletus DSM 14713 TaxID=1294270 RepID=A0A250IKZ5_9BACT|nr:DUF4091 domain-containing protein [Melittangium boletus]ATB31938.1 hypothetical protein MEBOL_005410 [Melittangium boletus DSM 14713]